MPVEWQFAEDVEVNNRRSWCLEYAENTGRQVCLGMMFYAISEGVIAQYRVAKRA